MSSDIERIKADLAYYESIAKDGVYFTYSEIELHDKITRFKEIKKALHKFSGKSLTSEEWEQGLEEIASEIMRGG